MSVMSFKSQARNAFPIAKRISLTRVTAERPERASVGAEKIGLRTKNGIRLLRCSEISFCKAESNYCKVVLTDGSSILVSKTLKYIQKILPENLFMRIHQSYLVHSERVKYIRTTEIQLDDGIILPVSRRHQSGMCTGLVRI